MSVPKTGGKKLLHRFVTEHIMICALRDGMVLWVGCEAWDNKYCIQSLHLYQFNIKVQLKERGSEDGSGSCQGPDRIYKLFFKQDIPIVFKYIYIKERSRITVYTQLLSYV